MSLVLPAGIPKDLEKQLQQIAPFPDICVQSFFQIKNKQGRIVPFRYNRSQKLMQERGTDFDMALKARKLGISSKRIPTDLWKCATRKNEHRILLGQTDDDVLKMMAERVKPFIDTCRFPLGAKSREDYIYFPLTGSRYYIGTAGSKKFGRGSDITGKHFTEYAHWKNPDVVAGVDEGLVDFADGLTETTANGHNFFKKDWDQAKAGRSRDRAIFLPWYCDEEYVRDPALEPGIMSEAEKNLIEAFGLSNAQIAWRRWKLRTMRDPSLFPQEYPETDTQAFLSSGRPVFDWVALERLAGVVCPPKFRGYLVRKHDRIDLVDDPEGPLRVWKLPERVHPPHVYAIGSDVAEGLPDGAYTTGEVLDLGDSEQVAEWHGHIAPDLWAEQLELLAMWYNHALIIPESYPGPGAVTTSHLLERHARLWEPPGQQDKDGFEERKRPGFTTTATSKTAMIAAYASALRDRELTIRSPELLAENHAFVYNEKMQMGPSLGNFSDRVMGIGIVWYCTRDIAARVDYYRAQKPDLEGLRAASRGGTSVPRREGPMPGRRRE